jgi:hypothetical protein
MGSRFDIVAKILLQYRGSSTERNAYTPLSVFSLTHGCWFRPATPGRDVPKRSGLRGEDACGTLSVCCTLQPQTLTLPNAE